MILVLLANRLLQSDRHSETAHVTMGRILAKKGDFANVRKQYEVMTALLADELGLEPSDETDKVFNNLKRFGQAESISQSSTAPQFVGTKILEAAPSFDLEILGPLEHFIK